MNGRILIVDDEKDFREFIASTLKEMGLDVLEAASGSEALDVLSKESVTAVLADLVMPQMSGLELLRNIRKRWPLVKVVILSGYGTVQNAVEAMKLGAFSFILKPLDVDDLMEEIENIVHHDVIAFLTMLSENIGEDARFLHLGMTSSDILDTTIGLQFKESTHLIGNKLEALLEDNAQVLLYVNRELVGRTVSDLAKEALAAIIEAKPSDIQ